jgi:hypothetical protein
VVVVVVVVATVVLVDVVSDGGGRVLVEAIGVVAIVVAVVAAAHALRTPEKTKIDQSGSCLFTRLIFVGWSFTDQRPWEAPPLGRLTGPTLVRPGDWVRSRNSRCRTLHKQFFPRQPIPS